VSFNVAGHQTEGYQVSTPVYEGPLDLLLQLIERAELDITRLALAQVTDQYLAHLRSMEIRNPAEVSAFLVIASRLVQIKSAALLPRPPSTENITVEEDPGEALARMLIQYRRFKQLAANLQQRDDNNQHTYLRTAPPPVQVDAHLDMTGIGLMDLVQAARQVLFTRANIPALNQVVNQPRITIRDRIQSILGALQNTKLLNFRFLLHSPTRLEVVVTFLAMLELIKRNIVEARQTSIFGEIEVAATGNTSAEENEPLEFVD
jgi:segregation and condensation protein A